MSEVITAMIDRTQNQQLKLTKGSMSLAQYEREERFRDTGGVR